jgi:hypothetical protein
VAKDPRIKAIEEEADRRSRLDGKTSHKERFRIRAELREGAGLGKEKKKRGGAAGVWDRNKDVIVPVGAGLLGLLTGGVATPMLAAAAARGLDREGKGGIGFDAGAGVRGAMEGAAAGGIGKMAGGLMNVGAGAAQAGAAGATAATPAASASQAMRVADPINGGMVTIGGGAAPIAAGATAAAPAAGFSLGNVARGAGNWLTANGGRNALGLATGISGVMRQQQGNELMASAAEADVQRWRENAPLRDAARAGMMAGVPGNPFDRGGR